MRRHLLAVAGVALAAGCGGAPSDKAGGARGDVRVLRLANANGDPGPLTAYAEAVEQASDGRLRIEFVNDYRHKANDADAEPGIIADVRSGRAGLAWVGARALRAQGVRELDPLIAPFAVTDYDAEERAFSDPATRAMLAAVGRIGVQPVALLPGPLQRLAMRQPWTGPADLQGMRIGAPAGIGSDAIRAMGAVPVVRGASHRLTGLDGDTLQLPAFESNHYMYDIPFVGSQPLWPRPFVVIASPALWKTLDARDREALVKAGTSAVQPVLEKVQAQDRDAVPELCRAGAHFQAADLPALSRAVAPVIDELRADPVTRPILAAIERLPKGSSAPLVCPKAIREAAGGIPPGEYRFTLTAADQRRRPTVTGGPSPMPRPYRAEISPGHLLLWVTLPDGAQELVMDGDFSTYRDRADFGGFTARWELESDGSLRFSDVDPAGEEDDFILATKPWVRVR